MCMNSIIVQEIFLQTMQMVFVLFIGIYSFLKLYITIIKTYVRSYSKVYTNWFTFIESVLLLLNNVSAC